jgi:hypothetical protein
MLEDDVKRPADLPAVLDVLAEHPTAAEVALWNFYLTKDTHDAPTHSRDVG